MCCGYPSVGYSSPNFAPIRLWLLRPGAVVDDGRCGRLWRVEDRTPRNGHGHLGVVFALWIGVAIGGFVAGWLLSLYGYQSNAVQTAEALKAFA